VELTPLWRTPTQAQAVEILRACRTWTDATIADLGPAERERATPLGDGTWSVKDLLGHLATHEHRALVTMGVRTPASADEHLFTDVHAFNALHLATKRAWSLTEVEADYTRTRDELVAAIDATPDERWLEKIPAGRGRSALALVLAKMLNGDRFGYFAHDLAHRRGLEQAVEALRSSRP
jgi:hypothetical protein